jgi:hypothetical protein
LPWSGCWPLSSLRKLDIGLVNEAHRSKKPVGLDLRTPVDDAFVITAYLLGASSKETWYGEKVSKPVV